MASEAYKRSLDKARTFFTAFPDEQGPITFTDGVVTWSVSRDEALADGESGRKVE